MMRIVHISRHDLRGGAARAAWRLHNGLRRLGQDSQFYVLHRASPEPSVTAYAPRTNLAARLRRLVRRRRLAYEMSRRISRLQVAAADLFTDDRSQYGAEVVEQIPQADVYSLHETSRFLDLPAFFRRLSPEATVLYYLHDMNPFTGGCHYAHDCRRFQSACGLCPQLGSTAEEDLSHTIWRRKHMAYRRLPPSRLQFLAPSSWMAQVAAGSSLLAGYEIKVLPYGLDIGTFIPKPREPARAQLGIPQDHCVLLFVAESVTDPRKGFALLADALASLQRECSLPLFLLSVGRNGPDLALPIPSRHLGRITDDDQLADCYSAADIFVMSSVEDAFGQTTLEAMACGTPVVGFDIGAVSDLVHPGETGYPVPVGDSRALAQALARLIQDRPLREGMRKNCRRVVVAEYSLEAQARKYLALCDSLATRSALT